PVAAIVNNAPDEACAATGADRSTRFRILHQGPVWTDPVTITLDRRVGCQVELDRNAVLLKDPLIGSHEKWDLVRGDVGESDLHLLLGDGECRQQEDERQCTEGASKFNPR